jgi:hypothetical protein
MLPWCSSVPLLPRGVRRVLASTAALPRARGRRDTETDIVQFAQAALAAAKQEGLQLAVRGRSTHVAQDDVSRHPIGDRCVAAIGTFETCRHCIERCLLSGVTRKTFAHTGSFSVGPGTDLKLTRCQQARHDFVQIWTASLLQLSINSGW